MRHLFIINIVILVFCLTGFSQTPSPGNFYTSFDKINIYYEVQGEGYPVVLIHGFTSDSQSWRSGQLYQDLLNAGYKVIALDMRGSGKSDKPHDLKDYQSDAEAKDIMGLLTNLGIKAYIPIGYSRGSIIASRLLVLDKRVTKAVMGGMGADFMNPEWPRRILFYRALMNEPVEELKGMVARIQEQGLDQRALACLQGAQPSTSKKEFSKMKQPVLVISGDQDTDNGSAAELAKLIPHGVLVTVPGVHGTTARSKQFSDEVLKFLK